MSPLKPVVGKTRSSTPERLAAQRALASSQADAVARMRTAAASLGTAISGLLAGAGVAALVAGPEHFDELASGWKDIGKVLFLLGAVAGLGAGGLATFASQPRIFRTLASPDAVRRISDAALASVERGLGIARVLSVLAALLVVASACVLWLGPAKQDPERVQGQTEDGKIVCGAPSVQDGVMAVKSGSDFYAATSLSMLKAVNDCP